MKRLERDRPSINLLDTFSVKEVLRAAASPHVIMVFIMFFMVGTSLFGLALFLPSMVNQLGFSPNKTQLLTVGPFAAAFFGRAVFFQSAISQRAYCLFVHVICSDFNFFFLVGSLPNKRYHSCPHFQPRRYRLRSLSR